MKQEGVVRDKEAAARGRGAGYDGVDWKYITCAC